MVTPKVAVYYETNPRGYVPENIAQMLIDGSRRLFGWISDHTLENPIPYGIASNSGVIYPAELTIDEPRALLLTTRTVAGTNNYGACLRTGDTTFRAIVRVPSNLKSGFLYHFVNRAKLELAERNITHELAHGYGIGHCATSRCIMFHYGPDKPFNAISPFCEEHSLVSR